mmetsp:Transcript_3158/g.9795  ORF Transcript_3158/g.9795 Transcript_3158/m.9795 type:complete len:215 (-) Transcript_3158:225-869(-)
MPLLLPLPRRLPAFPQLVDVVAQHRRPGATPVDRGAAARRVLAPSGRVPVVLDGVVRAPRQQLGDLRPLVAVRLVRFHENAVLLLAPAVALDVRVEVVVPALAALLANAARQVTRNHAPLLGAMLQHQAQDLVVLLLRPRPLDEVRVEHLLPAVQALNIGAVGEEFGDLFPVLARVDLDGAAQHVVLLRRPAALGRASGGPSELPQEGGHHFVE